MHNRISFRLLLPILLLVSLCGAAFATQTDVHGLHATPAPPGVRIDGRLEDWDLSGQTLMCYDLENMLETNSAQVALMYDANSLFISIHWKSLHPMANTHDPRYQAERAWTSDCVQLRINTDRISHVTAWYNATNNEPAISIAYGKSPKEPFGGGSLLLLQESGWKLSQGAEMAFRKDIDGHGYVQEMRLPWKLITKDRAYNPGDRLQCGFELFWGGGDWPAHRYADNLMPGKASREFFFRAVSDWGEVVLEPKGKLKLPEPSYLQAIRQSSAPKEPPGIIPVAYELPKAGQVTLVIEDQNGRRVRNLIAAVTRPAGHHVERWDGLDDSGVPVSPGAYRVRGIWHEPLHLKYLLSFANPGNPSWSTPDGRGAFYADHSPPRAAAAGDSLVALACPFGEAGSAIIGVDLTGQRIWGIANRTFYDNRHVALAAQGNTLWIATEGDKAVIYRVDLTTSKYRPWNREETDSSGNKIKTLDLSVSEAAGANSILQQLKKAGGTPAVSDASGFDPYLNQTAIAVHGNTLAVCLAREGKVCLLDSETGELKSRISIPNPRAICYGKDGIPIILSEGHLLRILNQNKAAPFTPARYPDGFGLAADSHGNIYLSVRGEDQDVKVFSPEGKLLKEIGRKGGRPISGPYNPSGMRNPAGIAIDSAGNLWAAEETDNPKRTSVWNVATGALVKDLPGVTGYSTAGSLNPFDISMGFSGDAVYRLNAASGTAMPAYSLQISGRPNELFPPHVHNNSSRVIKHGEDTLVLTSGSGRQSGELDCVLLHGGVWRSATHLGVVKKPDAAHPVYANPLFAGREGQVYCWSDSNGDGLVQPEELRFNRLTINGQLITPQATYWGTYPGPDGTITYCEQKSKSLIQFRIDGYTASGAPIYAVEKPDIIHPEVDISHGLNAMATGADGRIYLNMDPLTAIDHDGRLIFSYPSKYVSVQGSHNAPSSRPGLLIGTLGFTGTAKAEGDTGELFDLNGNMGQHYLFTSDGLLIASLFRDIRGEFDTPLKASRGQNMDNITAGGESFGGNFIRSADGRYLLTIGSTDARVLELTGLDTLRRLPVKNLTVNAHEAELARAGLTEQPPAKTNANTFQIAQTAIPPELEGKTESWFGVTKSNPKILELKDPGGERFARVAASWDASNLTLAYQVFRPRGGPRNAGQDYRLLFKTGDAVDVMLVAGSGPAAGSPIRLLMSRMEDKPVAVLYRQKVTGTPEAQRVPFASPTRVRYFDSVTLERGVKQKITPLPDGYLLEARIPWKLLGVEPRIGQTLRADIGALFADEGGTVTIARHYWSNRNTGLVNDIPGEAELTPSAWGIWELTGNPAN